MDAKTTATAILELLEGDKALKVDTAGELVDQLFGTDPTALVKNIKGLPAEYVELVTDGIITELKEALAAKLGA